MEYYLKVVEEIRKQLVTPLDLGTLGLRPTEYAKKSPRTLLSLSVALHRRQLTGCCAAHPNLAKLIYRSLNVAPACRCWSRVYYNETNVVYTLIPHLGL